MMRIDFPNYKVPGIVLAVSFFRHVHIYLTIAGFSIIHSYSLFTSDRMASSIYLVFMFHGMSVRFEKFPRETGGREMRDFFEMAELHGRELRGGLERSKRNEKRAN